MPALENNQLRIDSPKAPFSLLCLLYSFPVWWWIVYLFLLGAITSLARSCGIDLPALLTQPALCAPFVVVPVCIAIWLSTTRGWFMRHLLIALPVWFVLLMFSGLTQGAITMMFWHAMGCPIRDSLVHVEQRAPEMYLPNRCDKFMNERASMILELMDEKTADNLHGPDFVCRLLIFHSMSGPVECFSFRNTADGNGAIVFKEIRSEPNSFAWRMHKDMPHTYLQREQSLSKADCDKLSSLLLPARVFYEKNKFTSHWCIPRKEHYLLEFKKNNKYYFYEVDGKEPDDVHAPASAPLPKSFQDIVSFFQTAVR